MAWIFLQLKFFIRKLRISCKLRSDCKYTEINPFGVCLNKKTETQTTEVSPWVPMDNKTKDLHNDFM